ncbi:MAG: tRNA dihydrouridine synthase DusB [Desulfobacterales bacterium]|nr:tRNA dihydrouridine synthase DusB [Desulfobacterales bacterium]MDD3082902.1 tRNA dihydrouridine synthase DusB [Desulfobacterales bacterium]MDD3952066.1 tRNA dihydrouridine synthase DusB [Desulfobacterales bacterium]
MKPLLKIGPLVIDPPTVMAPMAGITDLPFRLLAKASGCGLVCSEMISANGLVYGSEKTRQLLISCPGEKPLSVQIFGADPAIMAEAAAMVQDSGADILDINFGCSVKKVLKSGAGSALMKTPEKAEAILRSVRKSVSIPLTIKIRTGWNPSGDEAMRIAQIAQDCGVDAVAIHPRTATQGFSGKAFHSLIGALKERLRIPVIGNGDIQNARDAVDMMEQTGCDGVMIGRGAIGNPWIFEQVRRRLNAEPRFEADMELRFQTMLDYLGMSVKYFGESRACRMMRSRLSWFVKGLPGSSRFRQAISRISSRDQAMEFIDCYRKMLESMENGRQN